MPIERILMSGKIERVHLEAQDLEAQLDDILKDVRKSLSRRAGEVEEKFLELCRDGEFRSSLGAGAKSVQANRIRFNR